MKKFKKILMAMAICSFAISLVACSAGKASKLDVIKKFEEASKTIKSSKVKAEIKMNVDAGGQKIETNMDMDMEMITDPIVIKAESKMSVLGQNMDINMYLADDYIYIQNPQDKTWIKTNDENTKKAFLTQKNSSDFKQMVDLFNSVEKDLKIEEKDSNYEVTYTGNDEAVKNIIMKNMNSMPQGSEEVLKNMKIEKFDIKYLIDKKTYLPIICEMKATMKISETGQEVSMNMDMKVNYSDINSIKTIEIPEEVKNAEEKPMH